MMPMGKKLKVIHAEEYETLVRMDPGGIYDNETREQLYRIIEKMQTGKDRCSWREARLLKRFRQTLFGLLLPKGDKTRGTIHFPGAMCIEGVHDGDVIGNDTLTVQDGAYLHGNVFSETVICSGKIVGNVHALKEIRVDSTGFLAGNITAPSIHIEDGAVFKGRCRLGEAEAQPVKANGGLAWSTRVG